MKADKSAGGELYILGVALSEWLSISSRFLKTSVQASPPLLSKLADILGFEVVAEVNMIYELPRRLSRLELNA